MIKDPIAVVKLTLTLPIYLNDENNLGALNELLSEAKQKPIARSIGETIAKLDSPQLTFDLEFIRFGYPK
jgi:hypothetical protein